MRLHEADPSPRTKAWAAKIEQFDAFVFVTPEYNHGPSAALKNAIDFLHREWNNKAVGFVGYGGNGGARSVEILRQVVSNVELADVRAQVGLSLFTDFENFTTFKPGPHLDGHRHARSGHRLGWRLEAPSHAEERLASAFMIAWDLQRKAKAVRYVGMSYQGTVAYC